MDDRSSHLGVHVPRYYVLQMRKLLSPLIAGSRGSGLGGDVKSLGILGTLSGYIFMPRT